MNGMLVTVLKWFFGGDLATSKKFQTFLVGVLTTILTPILTQKAGMDPGLVSQITNWVAGLVAALLAGQGMTDFGKAAAEANANSIPLPPPPDLPDGLPALPPDPVVK